jgi:HK97 gp10 family phage protein
MIQMSIQGAQEIERRLNSLEKKVAKSIVRKAVRAGAKPIHAAAKTNAKETVGGDMGSRLSKDLAVRAFKRQRRGQYGVNVRFKDDEKLVHITAQGKRQYIPAAIEYGHAFAGRGGKNAPKDVPAVPFLRPAFDTKKDAAERAVKRELLEGIERAARGA